MANKIQIKRGNKTNLPILDVGEPAICTDTNEIYVGTGSKNIELATRSDILIEKAGGTASAITLTLPPLTDGYMKTFIASGSNNIASTTINGIPLKKPMTSLAPSLSAGKAYTVWYDASSNCFFHKASTEGTAAAAQVLAGYTFSNDSDIGLSGSIPSKAAATITPGTADQTIAAGQYLSGIQTIVGDSNLVAANIKSGVSLFGVAGSFAGINTSDATAGSADILSGKTAYVNGTKITGNITSKGAANYVPTTYSQTISSGQYLSGTQTINGDSNLTASNIKSGISIFGVTGSFSGTVTSNNYTTGSFTNQASVQYTVNLPFDPSVIVLISTDGFKYYFINNFDTSNFYPFNNTGPNTSAKKISYGFTYSNPNSKSWTYYAWQ
jgi:hypothetical protein